MTDEGPLDLGPAVRYTFVLAESPAYEDMLIDAEAISVEAGERFRRACEGGRTISIEAFASPDMDLERAFFDHSLTFFKAIIEELRAEARH